MPEEFWERLMDAARRAREEAPPAEKLDGGLPPLEEASTAHGPSLVRSLAIGPDGSGLEGTFRKLSALADLLERPDLLPPDLEPLVRSGLEGALFLDLETTGFSSTPLFLAGTLKVERGRMHVRQFFARDYSQERSVLQQVSHVLSGCRALVTFNGKAYDLPFLRERCFFHGIRLQADPPHLDLLHPARRRWKHDLPNCRLVTLEWHLCGRHRRGDIPGSEIPAVYHEFVRRGSSPVMRRVFHHNVMDLVTLVELLSEIAAVPPAGRSCGS